MGITPPSPTGSLIVFINRVMYRRPAMQTSSSDGMSTMLGTQRRERCAIPGEIRGVFPEWSAQKLVSEGSSAVCLVKAEGWRMEYSGQSGCRS